MGSKWILGLRKCYQRSEDGTADALDVADETVTVAPSLYEAVDASRSQMADRTKLIAWMQKQQIPPNQTEMCGIYLHGLELKPWMAGTQHELLFELVKMIVRLKLQEVYPR